MPTWLFGVVEVRAPPSSAGSCRSRTSSMQAPLRRSPEVDAEQQFVVVGERVHVGLGAGDGVVGQRRGLRHRELDRVDDELPLRNHLGVVVDVARRLLPPERSRADHAGAAVQVVERLPCVTGPIGGELFVVVAVELVGMVGDVRVEGVGRTAVGIAGPHDRQLLVDREAVGVIGPLAVLPDERADVAVGGPDLGGLHVPGGRCDGLDRGVAHLLHVGRVDRPPDADGDRSSVGVGRGDDHRGAVGGEAIRLQLRGRRHRGRG